MKHVFIVLFCWSLCWGLNAVDLYASSPERDESFTDRVNLALRQVGHQLLIIEGDTHSLIPPVEMVSPFNFKLNLKQSFNYDSLPQLLNQAFVSYNIDGDYHVLVERCSDNIPILGYNFQSFVEGEIACVGREQTSECNNIVITFSKPVIFSSSKNLLFGLLLFLILGVLSYVLWKSRHKFNQEKISDLNGAAVLAFQDHTIHTIGSFRFDHKNQLLQIGETEYNLTFRESKLLHHLVQHINEIQSRDVILEKVWGDEGVMVGRSLDVFISRLRKMLKADEKVSIKTIHGVGYRLELAR
jgi:hypothetical protein